MRVTIERGGRSDPVEVAPDLSSVTIDGTAVPVKVLANGPTRVELEVAGERIVVDHWPEGFAQPPGPVDVGGERWKVALTTSSGPASAAPPPTARPGADAAPRVAAGVAGGVPVYPPMPGKVVEVRVREGAAVRKGDVLLRIEAMKMVNEIASPADGTVRDLRVSAGGNVRAREAMLYVVPTGTS